MPRIIELDNSMPTQFFKAIINLSSPGLVGGSVPVFDEIVLSTSNLNEVINIDEEAGELVLLYH